MHIASEKCHIFSPPLFCLTLHTVSLSTDESPKSTSTNFPQPLVLQKGYYTSQMILISTEFYNNLIAKCREKNMETEKHILADFIPRRQPYATEKLRGNTPPTNPVGFQNFNIFPDHCLKKEGP